MAGKLGRDTLLYITRARHEIHDARGKGAKRARDSPELQGKKIRAAEKIIPRSKEKGFHGQAGKITLQGRRAGTGEEANVSEEGREREKEEIGD